KVDARNLGKHRKDEARYLAALRKACRNAATWNYEQAKKARFDPRSLMPRDAEAPRWESSPDAPTCPRSEVARIDQVIATVEMTTQPRFTLNPRGKWGALYALLTEDVPKPRGLCGSSGRCVLPASPSRLV